jgi:hypothetical protein
VMPMGWIMTELSPGKKAMGTVARMVVRLVMSTGWRRLTPASRQAVCTSAQEDNFTYRLIPQRDRSLYVLVCKEH